MNPEECTPRDLRRTRLLEALLTHDTLKEAASAAEVPYQTAKRWLRDADMVAALTERRELAARESVLEAASLAQLARDTLRAIMADENAPAHARVRAATAALEYDRTISDLFDIDARLAALEQAQAEQR